MTAGRVLVPALHFHRRGGIEIYTWELARALRRLGWEPEIIACLQSGTGPVEGFEHVGLAPEDDALVDAHTARWPKALERYLAEREPNESVIVAAHPFTLPQIGPYARAHGLPLAVVFYGVEAWDLYDSLRAELETGGTVAAISRYTADALERQADIADGPVQLLAPPIDGSRFHPGPRADRDPLVLLTVSRLSMRDWFKGHAVVLDALPWLCSRVDGPLEYWIAGEGPYGEVLHRRAAELGVADRVRLLGFVDDARLPDLYRRADLFVMPSELGRQDDDMAAGEGFGMVFAEAAACGTPSVGLAHGGAAEAIADGVSGLAVASRDEVGPAILRLLNDREERLRLGRDGAAWARATFGHPAFDARLGAILEHALERPQGGSPGNRTSPPQAVDR